MLKQGNKIDDNGFFIEEVIYDDSQKIDEDIITVKRPQGLYKAKWSGTEWIETGTINLNEVKQIKIQQLSDRCNEVITKEFYSDVDGTKKLYDFELENQVNMSTKAYQIQISRLAGQPIETVSYYAKGETCHDYTADQFLQLAQEGETWKTIHIQKYKDTLKPMVLACTTADEVYNITFDMEIAQ